MADFDLFHLVEVRPGLNITAISTNTTTNGAIIDTQSYYAVMWSIQSGTLTDGTYTVQIRQGDESDLSDGTLTSADFLLGTIADASFAATDDNETKKIGYIGKKRYVRLEIVSASISSGGTLTSVAMLGYPRHAPAVQ